MVNAKWGTKRRCPKCGAVFYDFKKKPVICPKCGHELPTDTDISKPVREDKSRKLKKPAVAQPAPNDVDGEDGAELPEEILDDELPDLEGDEDIEIEDDADEALEDTSDLESDEEVIPAKRDGDLE